MPHSNLANFITPIFITATLHYNEKNKVIIISFYIFTKLISVDSNKSVLSFFWTYIISTIFFCTRSV